MIFIVGFILLVPALVSSTIEDKTNARTWGNKFVSHSKFGVYEKAAVATMGIQCSTIGKNILLKDGSAVDAAIATLLCEGVVSSFSSGLGGGFTMTIWDPKDGGNAEFLIARETAPAAANPEMFGDDPRAARYGPKSVAVPGELMGLWEAHQKYGRLPWRDLFQPAIELCENGYPVTKAAVQLVDSELHHVQTSPGLRAIFIDPKTGLSWPVGTLIKRPNLAETLKTLSEQNDVSIFYGGEMGEQLINDLKKHGGLLELSDLQNYKVKWTKPITSRLGDLTMYTSPPPGSGIILTFMMNVLQGLVPTANETVFWERFIETMKYAYADRLEIADPDFVNLDDLVNKLTSQDYADAVRAKIREDWTSQDPTYYGAKSLPIEDHGTLHLSVLAPDGSAVAVTSTINQLFASGIVSERTGILFNNQLNDFRAPDIISQLKLSKSEDNTIQPGRRPPTSTVPTIVVDENKKVRLIVGGAGGVKIISAIALTMVLNLWTDYTVKEAIDAHRLHHQLLPMQLRYYPGFNETILKSMEDIGHKLLLDEMRLSSTVTAIAQQNGYVTANADYRRGATVDGF